MGARSSHKSIVDSVKQRAEVAEGHVNHWRITPIAKSLFHRFSNDNTTGLASQVAYNLVFALPPLFIFLVTLAALVDHFTGLPIAENLHKAITQHAPADTKTLLDSMVRYAISQTSGAAATTGAVITVILALWGASGGVGTLIQAFNSAYETKDSRSFVRSTLLTLGLTVLMVVVVIVAFILFIFGHKIGSLVANQVGLGSTFELFWNILRWPVAIILFLLFLALLYYWGPDVKQSFRWVSPGSVVATILWILAVLGFKLYVSLSNPGSPYGAAGGLIVLLFFLYLTGVILILGAQINAVLQKYYAGDNSGTPATATAGSPKAGDRSQPAESRSRKPGAADSSR